MSKMVIGSVELHNAVIYYQIPQNKPYLKCDEFPKWIPLPASAMDPRDRSSLRKISKQIPAKERRDHGITVRVLRHWYEDRVLAFKALANAGEVVVVPPKEQYIEREKTTRTKTGRAAYPAAVVNSDYMNMDLGRWR